MEEKWQRRQGCTRRLTKALSLPVGRDKKIRTALRANQIEGFVAVPSEKRSQLFKNCSVLFAIDGKHKISTEILVRYPPSTISMINKLTSKSLQFLFANCELSGRQSTSSSTGIVSS